jgi:hypothetical protein
VRRPWTGSWTGAPDNPSAAHAMARVRLDFMVEPRYTVKALDQSTWAALTALVEHNNGIFGGCWCMAFHPEESCTDVAQKRAAKELGAPLASSTTALCRPTRSSDSPVIARSASTAE